VLRPTLRAGLGVLAACVLVAPAPVGAQEDSPPTSGPDQAPATSGRRWMVEIPAGCEAPDLPDVVFVGTLLQTGTPAGAPQEVEYETARFRLEQVRAGDAAAFSAGGMIDVRYGLDAKDLDRGRRYLVGASVDPAAGVLFSRVRLPEPYFGGDDVIAASERDVACPDIVDPVRTLHVDGTPIDPSIIGPFLGARSSLLRSLLLPLGVAVVVVFGLAAVRWLLTGVGKGLGAVIRTAAEPAEVRAAMRTRHEVHHRREI
jgi:hypothetical protein